MNIEQYCLGIKVDLSKIPNGYDHLRVMLCQMLSVLTPHDVKNIHLYGGKLPKSDEGDKDYYLFVFEHSSFKHVKRVFRKLSKDKAFLLFLDDEEPFIGKNSVYVHEKQLDRIGYSGKDGVIMGEINAIALPILSTRHKFILAPDSFKGSLTSEQQNRILAIEARESFFGARLLPVFTADGGEGTLKAIYATMGGTFIEVETKNALFEDCKAKYLILPDKETAVIESAEVIGLPSIAEEKRDIMNTTSYGLGALIVDAVTKDCKKIVVALGGTATNDGGIGCLKAMGAHFFNDKGEELSGVAADMVNIATMSVSGINPLVRRAEIVAMCDVKNPFVGLSGATMVYSPQKGASATAMFYLESGMKNLRNLLQETTEIDVGDMKYAGSAGGISGTLHAVLNAKLQSGIDTLLDTVKFDKHLKNASFVVSGEGRLDLQTVDGEKAVFGIAKRCKEHSVPMGIISGSRTYSDRGSGELSGIAFMELMHSGMTEEYSINNAEKLYEDTANDLFLLLTLGNSLKPYISKPVTVLKLICRVLCKLLMIIWKFLKKLAWRALKIIVKGAKAFYLFVKPGFKWLGKKVGNVFRAVSNDK